MLKQTLSSLLKVELLVLFFLFSGLFFLWRKRRGRGIIFCLTGTVLLLVCSLNPVANGLLRPLETQYPPYKKQKHVEYVVVLGGWCAHDEQVPLSGQLGSASLARLIEGIIIYRENRESKLFLSGSSPNNDVSNALMMAGVAQALGVPKPDIVLLEQPENTRDEARLISARIGLHPFVLVTSATHMPRAMALFQQQGGNPIPAPVFFRSRHDNEESLVPSVNAMQKIDLAVHEYLGMAWNRLRKNIE